MIYNAAMYYSFAFAYEEDLIDNVQSIKISRSEMSRTVQCDTIKK